ncbi:MAG: hypothetical protein AAGI92_12760 [Pseudomonadota bacterium]
MGREILFSPATPGTVAYLAAMYTLLFFSALVAAGSGRYIWILYSVMGAYAIFWQALEEQNERAVFWTTYYFDISFVALAGHIMTVCFIALASFAIPHDHWTKRFKTPFLVLAAINVLLAAYAHSVSAELSKRVFDVFNVMSMAAQLIPLSCMFAFESKRARFLIGTALLLPIMLAVLYFLLAFGLAEIPFNRFMLNRITLGSVILFGCSALVIRIFALRDDREQVLTERLAIAEEAAQTSQALLESERKYSEVQALARRRQQGFMEATHDIKQPLASLRTTIDTIGTSQSVEIRTQLRNAFDYLEQLADS